jgi:segregation and condensation protein B
MAETQEGNGLVPSRFQHVRDDDGFSLEELSTAYADLLSRGATPYEEPHATGDPPPIAELDSAAPPEDVACDLTPASILEAVLFVGNANNAPLTNKRLAALMRGVPPQEVDELVVSLNAEYAAEGRPYSIASVGSGYVLQLRSEFESLRNRFYGRVKEARLTPPAIDVLAIVAYRQPISREDVDRIRAKPSGTVLAQLLRRGLLCLERSEGSPRGTRYRTSDRFLQLFGLESLAELPQSQDALDDLPQAGS